VGGWALVEAQLTPDPTWRAFATFQNPNLLAGYLLPCVFLGLSGILGGRRPWLLGICLLTLFCGVGLVLTGSRGAVLVALPLAFLVWAALAHLARDPSDPAALRLQRFRLAAILVVALGLGIGFMKPTASRVGEAASPGEANSRQFRILTWKGTLTLIQERPILGWGPGAWEFVYPRVAQAGYTKAAHNSYLQIAAESGLPGLLLWLGVLATAMFGAMRRTLDEAGRIAALVALALHNAVDYSWLLFAPAALTWALIGAKGAVQSSKSKVQGSEEGKEGTSTASPFRRWIGYGAATLAILFTTLGLASSYAEWHGQQGMTYAIAGDRVQAQREFAAAARIEPTDGEWPRRQGDLADSPEEAIAFYREAVSREPLRAPLHYRLAQVLTAAGQTDEARKSLLEAIRLDPNSTSVLRELAELDEAAGRAADALTWYRRIAEVQDSPVGQVTALAQMEDPNYSLARLKLAEDAVKRKDSLEARKQIEAGLKSANAYLDGLETWQPIMEAAGRYNPALTRQVEETKASLESLQSKF
jgi:tetratricopeptide (TPR) repeat protein